VYAFEPCPKTFAVLEKNLELNGYRNTVLVNRAVSDTEGLACLFEDSDASGNNSLFSGAVPAAGAGIGVETTTLDTFVHSQGIGRFHLLKADAQGSEYLILAGGADCLRRFRPMLCLEFWPLGIGKSGARPEELLALVRSLGYKVFIIRDGARRLQQLESSSDDEILSECRVRGGERGFCDILAIPPAGSP
jgi:FkbM family methyltransferase